MSGPHDSDRDGTAACISVAMGEIGAARHAGTIRTFLGSCVGVALHEPRLRLACLAHVVLPAASGGDEPPGKYADTALPEMLRLLAALADGAPLALRAKLVGGASMFAFQSGAAVGEKNVRALERLLGEAGIPIVGRDCGGRHGRRLSLDVATGAVTVEAVGAGITKV